MSLLLIFYSNAVGIPKSSSVILTFIKVPSFNTLLHQITLKYDYGISSYNYDICRYHLQVCVSGSLTKLQGKSKFKTIIQTMSTRMIVSQVLTYYQRQFHNVTNILLFFKKGAF